MTQCEHSSCRNEPRWHVYLKSKADGRIVDRTLCTFHAKRVERGEWVVEATREIRVPDWGKV